MLVCTLRSAGFNIQEIQIFFVITNKQEEINIDEIDLSIFEQVLSSMNIAFSTYQVIRAVGI